MSTGTDLPAATQGKPATAARGAFERLHAFDGLFLRAEHLVVMQDYARDLVMAGGRAGGSGVVQGYGLRVDESADATTVVADPGLAVAPDGRPMLATEPLTVTLEDRNPGDSTYYRVRLQPGTWHHGEEPVQGLLCDEPCLDGTTRHVLTAEGPWLSLEAVSDDRFGAHKSGRRSWLARHLFTEEEADVPRWPGPEERDLPDQWAPWRLTSDPGGSVCLGVVFKESGDWQLDIWAARRDRGGSPPTNRWQWGLGMRPWEVFVAHVLQFQAQLGDILRARAAAPAPDALEARLGTLEKLLRELGEDQRTTALRQITEITKIAQRSADKDDTPSLAELGFLDLPPAGFLPSPAETEEGTAADIARWLGDGLVRRVCSMSVGDLGEVFTTAQSRPRTPLDGNGAPALDIYVPVDPGSERATSWVLFVRADDVECAKPEAPPTDEVDVFVRARDGDSVGDPQHLGTLHYPQEAWSVPEDVAEVFEKVQALVTKDGVTAVEATTRTAERQPLGLLRAALLATAFTGQEVTPVGVCTRVKTGTETITLATEADTDVEIVLEQGSSTDSGSRDDSRKEPENRSRASSRRPRRQPRPPKEDDAGEDTPS